ncbi:MAG: tellurite resistance TerB family protein [Gammaproteobacteria bacterium]|nr:tellurite resistance TerB family protein [Gammaproteobacteria bacterium]
MVSAAKADGQIDSSERNRIAGRVKESGAGAEALEFLMEEMQRPLDLDGLAAKVTGPEEAIEVYGASLLAIELDTDAEVQYLRRLASGLGLESNVVGQIHQALGAPVAA